MKLLCEHEKLVSSTLNLEPTKQKLFSDFNGSIKSLGAWGGDFVLAASEMDSAEVKKYFAGKGYKECFDYTDFVL